MQQLLIWIQAAVAYDDRCVFAHRLRSQEKPRLYTASSAAISVSAIEVSNASIADTRLFLPMSSASLTFMPIGLFYLA